MERKLASLFDYQRFQQNPRLKSVIQAVESCYTGALDDDDLDALAGALITLKEKERDLIVLHYQMGHTLKVVAEMMGMSYVNAKVIHKKAIIHLQEK